MASYSNSKNCNFGFAFNDPRFSDRLLLIEVMQDSEIETCGNDERGTQFSKRRRQNGEGSSGIPCNEYNANPDMPALEDGHDCGKKDEDVDKRIVEASSGCLLEFNKRDEASNSCVAIRSDCLTVRRVKTMHVSSAILAAHSPFFYKLFSNGMKETEQRTATLRINADEEAALRDVLNFIYFDTVLTTTSSHLMKILFVAEKFEVVSCMRYCSEQLSNLPMTYDSALRYLDLTSSFARADAVEPLTDAAKRFLAALFKDLDRLEDQVLELPLSGIEAVLSSDELKVASEDAIYDLVLNYSARHYQQLEDRKEILDRHFLHLIRFPYMSTNKLKKALTCGSFDSELISELVTEALFFKTDATYRHHMLASTRNAAGETRDRFVERAYKYKPVKVMEIEQPYHHCVVYMDLKREECRRMFPGGKLYSQAFHLGSHGFFLSARCNMNRQNTQSFGFYVGMQRGYAAVEANYEFAARIKPEEEFEVKYQGRYVFTGVRAVGVRNLFAVPWNEFISEESDFFINGILHLRAMVAFK